MRKVDGGAEKGGSGGCSCVRAARRPVLGVLVASIAAAGGCGDQRADVGAPTPVALTVPVPAVTQFALLASRAVSVGDRSQVNGGDLGVAAGVTNTLTAGIDSRVGVGEVLHEVREPVGLDDRVRVDEDADLRCAAADAVRHRRAHDEVHGAAARHLIPGERPFVGSRLVAPDPADAGESAGRISGPAVSSGAAR